MEILIAFLGILGFYLLLALCILVVAVRKMLKDLDKANTEMGRLRNHFDGPLCVYVIPYDGNKYTATLHKHLVDPLKEKVGGDSHYLIPLIRQSEKDKQEGLGQDG